MYTYARPPAGRIMEPTMRITDQRCASIVGRVIAYVLVAALAVAIFSLA
jgi:hypothetical protein